MLKADAWPARKSCRCGAWLLLEVWRVGMAVMLGACLALAGCATQSPPLLAFADSWTGRLALQVEGYDAQSFSAAFELRGNSRLGELVLLSPLGNRLAQLTWREGHAELISAQGSRTSPSLDALLADTVGAPLPVAAIFEWLQGQQASAPGWDADLSAVAQGKIFARRHSPLPAANLRIALTR
jgi:outer membrane lipoprotein LolB